MSDRLSDRRPPPPRKVSFLATVREEDFRALVRGGLYLEPTWGDRPAEELAAFAVAELARSLEAAQRRPGSWERLAFQGTGMVEPSP